MTWIADFILGILIILCFYLSPIRIIQYYIAFAATADEYFSAVVLICVLPVVFYKVLKDKSTHLKITKITLLLIFWVAYASLTIFWAIDYFRYFTEIVQLIISALLMYLIYTLVDTREKLTQIFNGLVVAGVMLALLSIVNYNEYQSSAINYYAIIALFTLIIYPLSRYQKLLEKKTIGVFICVFLGLLIIHIHDSRAALGLGGLIIIWRVFWLNKMNKKLKYFLVITAVLAVSIYALGYLLNTDYFLDITDTESNFSNLERIALLQQAWDLFLVHPFGMGQGASNNVFMNSTYTVLSYPHPHNTFAHLLTELGFVGLIIYLTLLVHIFRSWIKANKVKDLNETNYQIFIGLGLSLAILFAYSFFEDFLFNGVFNLYIFTFIGICLAMKNLLVAND
ncbi:O-antigen ligase family protein [Pedobacter sp.]|uniref:O-antigen ligase family protein n=1 Tax=Pedobacter sp. TaxID=1411316 RepID=UPI00396CDD4C